MTEIQIVSLCAALDGVPVRPVPTYVAMIEGATKDAPMSTGFRRHDLRGAHDSLNEFAIDLDKIQHYVNFIALSARGKDGIYKADK